MSHDRKPWSKRKPYVGAPGYVASLKCRLGGWIVVYDRTVEACDVAGDARWVVMHQPSTRFVCLPSQARARDLMKFLASAYDLAAAGEFANLITAKEVAA